ncbi:hypothetical protein SASPL_126960 [Salvia splendens]|uniref:Uncharacterized protein n=1 Tax=Salvia splendens TaxID=180675 RepID=A0A8X8ZQH7_SALSN|nr:hypothetical protein SASPL_126960 [Salvia splendens]
MELAMLGQAALPSHFWDDAFVTVNHPQPVLIPPQTALIPDPPTPPTEHHDHHSDLSSTHIPSSDSPSAQGTSSTRPMITRAKAGVFKPKLLIVFGTRLDWLLKDFEYFETFSLVVKPNTIRIILSLATSVNWSVTHLDVKMLFFMVILSKKFT